MASPRLAIHIPVILAFAVLGIAVRNHDANVRGLEYDERTTIQFAEDCSPEVFGEYLLLRNVREPGHVPMTAISLQDYRSFPAWLLCARALQTPNDHPANISRLRWLSVLLAGLAVPSAYILGLRFGPIAAVLTAMMALLHPTCQFHGYNIRFYALLIFVSTAGLAWYVWVMPAIPKWFAAKRRGRAALAILASAACVGAMFTVHLGVIFPIAVMLVIAWHHLRFSRAFAMLLVATLAFSAIPLFNIGNFFYVRTFADASIEEIVNSTGPLPGLAAVAFNMGLGYCALAGMWLLNSRSGDQWPIRWGLAIAFFGIALAFAMKASLLRADYTLGLLPAILLAAALQIQTMTKASGQPWRTGAIVFGFALLLVLPSFWSTAVIDGDRVDYAAAIRFLREDAPGEKILVITHSPRSMDYLDAEPGVKPVYIAEVDLPEQNLAEYSRVYWIVREGKGFQTVRRPSFDHVEGKLVRTLGKDRLDLRSCRLYVFRSVKP